MSYGPSGPSGGSLEQTPFGSAFPLRGAGRMGRRTFESHGHRPAVDEDHLFLYQTLSGQIAAVQAILARASPESFRYRLQESKLLTYLVEDPRRDRGFCTLLPWGYMFTSDHQPAVHSVHIPVVSISHF